MRFLLTVSAAALAAALAPFNPYINQYSRGTCTPMDQYPLLLQLFPNINFNDLTNNETRIADIWVRFPHFGWMGNASRIHTFGDYGQPGCHPVFPGGPWECPCTVESGNVTCMLRSFTPFMTNVMESAIIAIDAVDNAFPAFMGAVVHSESLGHHEIQFDVSGCDFSYVDPGASGSPMIASAYYANNEAGFCGQMSYAIGQLTISTTDEVTLPSGTAGMLIITEPTDGSFKPGVSHFQWWSADVGGMTDPEHCMSNGTHSFCNLSEFVNGSGLVPSGLQFRQQWLPTQTIRVEMIAPQTSPYYVFGSVQVPGRPMPSQVVLRMPCQYPAGSCDFSPIPLTTGNCPMALPDSLCDTQGMACDYSVSGVGGKLVEAATHIICRNGHWVGEAVGCALVPGVAVRDDVSACPARSYEMFEGRCAAGYEGSVCTMGACAAGLTGTPTGSLTCTGGKWVGTLSGCGVSVPPCQDPLQRGYLYSQCTFQHGSICKPTGCAAGYTGSATGQLACLNGEWRGEWFGGCSFTSQTEAPCASALMPPAGYQVAGCGSGSASGTRCSITCDAGANYTGVAHGEALCFDGQWFSNYAGCTPICTLPPSVCVNGRILPQYYVRGVYAEQKINERCELETQGQFALVQLGCSGNYIIEDGTPVTQTGPAVCIGGFLVGGFARNGPPVCRNKADVPDRECKCGKPGELAKSSTLAVSGKIRMDEYQAGFNEWSCTRTGNHVTCSCTC